MQLDFICKQICSAMYIAINSTLTFITTYQLPQKKQGFKLIK